MKTETGKKWNEAAQTYAGMAANREADAYEYDINFPSILNPSGVAIISVVHPIYWHTNYLQNNYKIESRPEFEVMDEGYYSTGKRINKFIGGNKNLKIGFIHRTLSDYINPIFKVDYL